MKSIILNEREQQLQKDILCYIELNDTTSIQRMYSEEISTSKNKQTLINEALYVCLKDEKPKIYLAKFFIKNGADINQSINDNNNPDELPLFIKQITYPSSKSRIVATFLLNNGYEIQTITDHQLNAPIHLLLNGEQMLHSELIDLILTKKTNINQQNIDGDTPLHLFFDSIKTTSSLYAANILLDMQPNIHLKNNQDLSVYESFMEWQSNIIRNGQTIPSVTNIITTMNKIHLEQQINNNNRHSYKKNKV